MGNAGGDIDRDQYLRWHVYDELRWLLVSATTWKACEETKRDQGVDHLVALAMDSAFLHARNLYEFFRDERGNIVFLFGSRGPRSEVYFRDNERLKDALHRKLFHLARDREFKPRETEDDILSARVAEIAADVLARWDEWRDSSSMEPYRATLDELRATAVGQATHAAHRLGIAPIFH